MRARVSLLRIAPGIFVLFACQSVATALSAATAPLPATTARPEDPATFSVITGREPVASLDGQWRFHPGDDLRWSAPTLDDAAWPVEGS